MDAISNSSYTIPIHRNPRVEDLMKSNCKVIQYDAKEKFLEFGDSLDGVYYIFKGRTKHYILAEDGSEKIIYTLSDGWFFGETPVTLDEPTGLISETPG